MKVKNNFLKNVIIVNLIVFLVFSGSNVDQGAQGHCPPAFGWFTVSKVPKISELWFVYESTKKKRFEKRTNVCKWLKNVMIQLVYIQVIILSLIDPSS